MCHRDLVTEFSNALVVCHGTRSEDLNHDDALFICEGIRPSSSDLFKDDSELDWSLEWVTIVGWSADEGCWH